jgi:EAL domain-containing protein (putative c-di-GMP-specific phosphodiesterase class I)
VLDTALRAADLDPGSLWLEITESAVMADVDAAIATLRDLKRRGVCLSIDDFGTGYSSLSYLKRLPIDALKVDRSFVSGVVSDSEDHAIAEAVVALAHTLGLSAVAEGVETPEQLAEVRHIGCDSAQGFLFARPAEPAEVEALLLRGPRW